MAKGNGGTRMSRAGLPLQGTASQNANTTQYETALQRKAVAKIRTILDEIDRGIKRPSISKPFAVGVVDSEIRTFALINSIDLGSGFMYMTQAKIKRAFRGSKPLNKQVSRQALSDFPISYHSMDIYFQKSSKNFIYTDNKSYYVLSPKYILNDRGNSRKLTLQISASAVINPGNFKGSDYVRVK